MKQLFAILAAVLITAGVFAQAPEKMSYQAVVRDADNNLVTEQPVGMQISILQGSADGTEVYVETQTPTTNANGLVSLEIGTGSVVNGDFTTVNWASGPYFIKTETDPTGGTNYTIIGTSQLLSVPYALHAKTAENVFSGYYNDLSNAPDLTNFDQDASDDFDGDYNNLINQPTISVNVSELTNDAGYITSFSEVDGSVTNEIQNLSDVLVQSNDGGTSQIKNIADPTDAQDAVTKSYVEVLEAQIEELQITVGLIVKDFDGNIYNTVTIGTQIWMAENLKTTKYNDGTNIPLETDNSAWINLSTGAYCWYNNDEATYKDTYGALYNWLTVNTGNLCPTGWHVPTDAEWTTLENYLIANGYNYDGTTTGNKTAKSLASTTNWISSFNTGTVGNTDYPDFRNKTGFTALPGGTRSFVWSSVGEYGAWWSATGKDATNAWYRYLFYDFSNVTKSGLNKMYGISVRCIKD